LILSLAMAALPAISAHAAVSLTDAQTEAALLALEGYAFEMGATSAPGQGWAADTAIDGMNAQAARLYDVVSVIGGAPTAAALAQDRNWVPTGSAAGSGNTGLASSIRALAFVDIAQAWGRFSSEANYMIRYMSGVVDAAPDGILHAGHPDVVPLPASLPLFAAAVLALGGIGWWRAKAKA